jgi:DinB superfamily
VNEHEERQTLIQQYADGPTRLRRALAQVPPAALLWRPAVGEWSVHEIVCHCADSETNAASRIRYLAAETNLILEGYNPALWATAFDYYNHPFDLALTLRSVARK